MSPLAYVGIALLVAAKVLVGVWFWRERKRPAREDEVQAFQP
jgi:hypothetical protein